jgi:dGTPase
MEASGAMTWMQLLSQTRVSASGQVRKREGEAERSQFQRDWDRLIFSNALRRMHDKTQVFPLPEDDVVHSRLTHSLEAASVGRSIAHAVGSVVIHRHRLELSPSDLGAIVAAACLAHDIGNPPFGHAGEDAISEFFRCNSVGQEALKTLSPEEQADFIDFEGNAQGFRTIARLQMESGGGMRLTAATLAAFMKYPRLSGEAGGQVPVRPELKKHGIHRAERAIFEALCQEVGLLALSGAEAVCGHVRHPLAYLVEAADDICYSILDIEDGVRLNLVSARDADEMLLPIVSSRPNYQPSRPGAFRSPLDRVGYLRAIAISQLIEECTSAFLDSERELLSGTHVRALKDGLPSGEALGALNRFAREKCYQSAAVLEIELAGYQAIGGLLHDFVDAVLSEEGKPSKRQRKTLELIGDREGEWDPDSSRYERLLRVTDYVSGMTDRFALALYRRIRGISVPGRLA